MAPSLPSIISPELLRQIRGHPDLPEDVWYFVAATTLCELNRPDEVQTIFRHAAESSPDEENAILARDEPRRIARRMREALVKASAIGGMPKTINALHELKKATPEHLLDEPSGPSPTARRRDIHETPTEDILRRGQAFFDNCYGKVASRVMGQLDHSGTEDLGLAVRLTYGYILSTTAVLSEAETSCVAIAGLIPQDVNPQLKGHLRGALNGGATVEQVKAVRQIVIDICHAAGMKVLEPNAPGGWGWRTEVADL